jgi:Ca2+-binding RTX toxin-like protein
LTDSRKVVAQQHRVSVAIAVDQGPQKGGRRHACRAVIVLITCNALRRLSVGGATPEDIMTTTPTFWSNEITFSFDFNAFGPQVVALADNTFAVTWESQDNIFGRHLNEFGSFTGGNFLADLSGANPKPLFNPVPFQQADGSLVVTYGEVDAETPTSIDRDIHWHQVGGSPTNTFPVEQSGNDEIMLDATARSDGVGGFGSAIIFNHDFGGSHLALRFLDSLGNQTSSAIPVGVHAGQTQQNPTLAGLHTGFVAAAYENVTAATGERQIRMHIYTPGGTDVSGEVNVSFSGDQASFPDIAALTGPSTGMTVVTWQQGTGLAFKRFIGNGIPLDTTPVLIPNTGAGLLPKITPLNDGGFLVAWTDLQGRESDGSPDLDVVMQRFSSSGAMIGTQLRLDEPGDQGLFGMSLATLDDGRVIVTYVGETGDSTNINTLNYRIVDPRDPTISGSNGADNIVGRQDASTILGFDGNDKLTGLDASDTLKGGNGADQLTGGLGNDRLDGGAGNDRLDGGAGNDTYYVDEAGDVVIDSGPGTDTVTASVSYALATNAAIEVIRTIDVGSTTPINLTGNAVANSIFGNNGANTLLGLGGSDVLRGNAGNDVLDGGAGNDLLIGGLGRDSMTGGLGRDVFDFNAVFESPRGAAHDTVFFQHGDGDRIDLATIDARVDLAGNQAFTFIGGDRFGGVDGELRFAGGLLQGDVNGDGVADIEIRVVGTLVAGDVIL